MYRFVPASLSAPAAKLVEKIFPEGWLDALMEKALVVVLLVVCTTLLVRLLCRTVRRVLVRRYGKGAENASLTILLINLIRYGLIFISLLIGMKAVLGINPSALLATAGLASVVVGFGAQSLVKDIISGFFMLMEDYYSVGDLVTLEGTLGRVEYLGLRSTKIRTFEGDLYSIPNGSVSTVLNHARGDRSIYLEIPVGYEQTLPHITELLEPQFAKAAENFAELAGLPAVLGISRFGESCMYIKLQIACKEGQQYAAERKILGLVKQTFDENGIAIPYNRLVVQQAGEGSRS